MPKCIPGFTLEPEREHFARSCTFQNLRGVRVCVSDEDKMKPKMARGQRTGADMQKTADFAARPTTNAQLHPALGAALGKDFDELPAWDALDRHVLRFYGYFKEAVTESNLENWRVRRVIIFYYLEDDTLHITDPRIDNAGLPQGTLVRRHRFPSSEEGTFITPADLVVGQDLYIYGKKIRLIDCDAF